jgi:hypothetical protein
VKLEYEIDAH